MRFQKRLFSLLIAPLAASPAVAWDHDFGRGLDLYSATDNGTTIRVVCDPDRVYGSTESMVRAAELLGSLRASTAKPS